MGISAILFRLKLVPVILAFVYDLGFKIMKQFYLIIGLVNAILVFFFFNSAYAQFGGFNYSCITCKGKSSDRPGSQRYGLRSR
jgi:hypothetical protein